MIKIYDAPELELYDCAINKKYRIDIKELEEGEKMSAFSNTMFMAMFQNEERLIYSALLLSYILKDVTLEEIVKNLTLVKNELDKNVAKKKGLRSDYVASIKGAKINIEINNNSNLITMERNMEYAFRLYSSKVTRDNKKYDYRQLIQININNFAFKGNDKVVDIYTLRNEERTNLSNKIVIVQIYVPNIRKKWYNEGVENLNELEKYILTIIETNIQDSLNLGRGHKIMEDYIKDAIKASKDEILLEAYDKEWAIKDEALREGYEEGLEQGLKDGLEQGIEQNKIEVVLNMLKKNLDIKLISEITNLSIEEIKSIKQKNI